jgi:hypothetical protein
LMYLLLKRQYPRVKLVFQSWSVVMLPALALDCGSFFNKSNFIIPFSTDCSAGKDRLIWNQHQINVFYKWN